MERDDYWTSKYAKTSVVNSEDFLYLTIIERYLLCDSIRFTILIFHTKNSCYTIDILFILRSLQCENTKQTLTIQILVNHTYIHHIQISLTKSAFLTPRWLSLRFIWTDFNPSFETTRIHILKWLKIARK